MNQRFASPIWLLAIAALNTGTLSGQPKMSVTDISLDAGKTLHFTVKNQTNRVITMYAWQTTPGGTQRTDFFPSIGVDNLPDVPRATLMGGVRPGETQGQQMPWGEAVAPKVEVTALIFDDGTAWGDETQIEEAFLRRAEQAHEDAEMCPELDPARWKGMNETDTKVRMRTLAEKFAAARSSAPTNSAEAAASGERGLFVSSLKQVSLPGQYQRALDILRAHCAAAPAQSIRRSEGKK